MGSMSRPMWCARCSRHVREVDHVELCRYRDGRVGDHDFVHALVLEDAAGPRRGYTLQTTGAVMGRKTPALGSPDPNTPLSSSSELGRRRAFDPGLAAASLSAVDVNGCRDASGPVGTSHITVTFAPDGGVLTSELD